MRRDGSSQLDGLLEMIIICNIEKFLRASAVCVAWSAMEALFPKSRMSLAREAERGTIAEVPC